MVDRIEAVLDKKSNRVVGRLMKDVDLFGGIKEVCRRFDIQAAQFQCIGSLRHATYVQLEKTSEGVLQYTPKIVSDTEVELLNGTGFVGYDLNDELDVHFHGMFVDCHKQIYGGHFLDGENPVAITIEFILLPVENVELKRGPDQLTNIPVFQFAEKE
ncbi:PPC domain-containing DNA-binding protein [Psychrobacillus lasiicapitis]|uniref:PPC domain-containing DNA-binding protein n=1 Tax=Psychrobacillus lasiicapitis TaxID=1636719 RepID=UPI0019C11AE7|nr:PPC domain-containing DNA-binding protein [Psychrobacillus lasiicapitis]GGA18847.1 hypothetical protein GCM10011384_05090 [Psychrobacillus lasiicapitis]